MATREIGIFALPTVLVPGELMPLHVFEERYKQLIGDCRDLDRQFLLLYADDDGHARAGLRGAASIEVLERFDDGRLNIMVEGTRGGAGGRDDPRPGIHDGDGGPADDDLSAGDGDGAR